MERSRFGVLLALATCHVALAGFMEIAFEQGDNFGRGNPSATQPARSLQGWNMEDDQGTNTGQLGRWANFPVTTGGFSENLFGVFGGSTQFLRAGGTAAAGACDGLHAGSNWMASKFGIYANFKRFSVDFAAVDGGTLGVFWNYVRRAGTPAAGSFRSSRGYYWTARSVPGQEQCWGVQRIENGNVVSVLARGATNVTFAPGNLLHTLTITKSGAVMNMTLRRMGVIIAEQSWTDPAGSLQPGFIGLMQGGINTVGFDNLQIIDDPRCDDTIMNGAEEGVDCGGPCTPCTYPLVLTHNWADQGISGWANYNYGQTTDAARWWVEDAGRVWSRTNHGTDHAGGTNCRVMWQGSHFVAHHFGPMYDFQLDVTMAATDNDGLGILFRYIDPDNFYAMMTNDEENCITIKRRRGGVDVQLASVTDQLNNGLGLITTNGYFGVEAYTSGTGDTPWRLEARGNRFRFFRNLVLILDVFDVDDGLSLGAGYIGWFQQRCSGVGFANPTVQVFSREPTLSPGWGAIGRRSTLPLLSLQSALPPSVSSADAVFNATMGLLVAPIGTHFNIRNMRATAPLVMHLDSATLAPTAALRFWPDQSGQGNAAHTRVMYAAVAAPAVTTGSGEANAVTFAGTSFLNVFPKRELNPMATGLSVVVSFKPTVSAASVVLALGRRVPPQTANRPGYRLVINPTTPATATWSVGSTMPLSPQAQHHYQFTVASASVTFPIEMGLINSVGLIIAPVPSLSRVGEGGTEEPVFNISFHWPTSVMALPAWRNSVLWTGNISALSQILESFSPISVEGTQTYMTLGSEEDGTSARFTGSLYDVAVFSGPLADNDMRRVLDFLAAKHGAVGTSCPAIIPSATGARQALTGPGLACSGAVTGDRCLLECPTGTVNGGGATTLTCLSSRLWDQPAPLTCITRCPSFVPLNAGPGCTYGPTFTFDEPGAFGLNSSVPLYRQLIPSVTYAAISPWIAGNGRLRVTAAAGDETTLNRLSLLPGSTFHTWTEGISVSAVMQQRSGTFFSAVQLRFREVDLSTYYFAEINAFRSLVRLGRVVNNIVTMLTCTGPTTPVAFNTDITLTVQSAGTRATPGFAAGSIVVLVNGRQFCSVVDTQIPAGGVSLVTTGNTDAEFDNVAISFFDRQCGGGCPLLAAGWTCTQSCAAGFAPSSGTVTCNANGTLSGAYVCSVVPPTFNNQSFTVQELVPVGTSVGRINATSLSTLTRILYTIVGGNTDGAFAVDPCSGALSVANPVPLDFENIAPGQRVFNLRMTAAIFGFEATSSVEATVTINILDANDPPIITTTSLSVSEAASVGSFVGTIQAFDPEGDLFTMDLVFGNTGGLFALGPSGGLTIAAGGILDFETTPSYQILIRAMDSRFPSTVFSQTFVTVLVTDANDAPRIQVGPQGILTVEIPAAGLPAASQIGAPLPAIDQDRGDTQTWQANHLSGTVGLVSVTAGGLVLSLGVRAYAPNTDYVLDGRIVNDFQDMAVSVRDRAGAADSTTLRVYYLANIAAGSQPIVRGLSVLAADPATGAGSSMQAGSMQHLTATAGDDLVEFQVDNLLHEPLTMRLFANVSSNSTQVGYRSDCTWTGTVRPSAALGGANIIESIRCPVRPAWGRGYNWVLFRQPLAGGAAQMLRTGVSLTTDYAPPIIGQVTGDVSDPLALVTVGGTNIRIQGFNFGPLTATNFQTGRVVNRPLQVVYGAPGVYEYTVTTFFRVDALSNDHVRINFGTVEGVGQNMQVRISLGGYVVEAGPSNILSYAPSTITNLVVQGAGRSRFSLDPRGGDRLIVTGANFGPRAATGREPILFFGPALEVMPLRFQATCLQPAGMAAHSTLNCTLPAGLGRNLTFIVTAGDRIGVRSTLEASYAPPVVTGVSGAAALRASTLGGQTFIIDGTFGPAQWSQGSEGPMVTYGTAANPMLFTPADCLMIGAPGLGRIQCTSAPGAGAGLVIRVNVGGQWGPPGGSFSYAAPVVSNFELDPVQSPGTDDALTVGGEDVIIYGSNFGPASVPVVATYFVTLINPGNFSAPTRSVTFTSPSCTKGPGLLAHSQVTCRTAPGAGEGLTWQLFVLNQRSANPVTSYEPPVITEVTLADGVTRADDCSTEGGTVVWIHGRGFGPSSLPGPLLSSIQYGSAEAFTADPTLLYTPLSFTIVSDGLISIVLAPGIGAGLRVRVTVADVVSTLSPVGRGALSYRVPRILSMSPTSSPTRPRTDNAAASRLRIMGTGLGLLDAGVSHRVAVGPYPPVTVDALARYPTLDRVRSGNLTTDELDPSRHWIQVPISAGVGRSLGVRVIASTGERVTVTVSSNPGSDGSAAWFNYEDPVITGYSVDSLDLSSGSPQAALMVNKSRVYFGEAVDVASVRLVSLLGRNFGPSDAVYSRVEVQATNDLGQPLNNAPFSSANVRADPDTWTHESMVVYTLVSPANLRISVPGTGARPDGVPEGPQLSNVITYTDGSPRISAIVGMDPLGYPTVGGDIITFNMQNLAGANQLSIIIGNGSCPLLDGNGVEVPPASVKATILDPQFNARPGNVAPNEFVWTIRCRLPAGQGSAVPITVVREGSISGTSAFIFVRYRAPTLTDVALLNPVTTGFELTTARPVRIATTGASVRLRGSNFGTCPTVRFGIHRGAACAADRLQSDSLVIGSFSHTELTVALPVGWGSGLQESAGLRAYHIDLYQGDQLLEIPTRYALPTVSTVLSSASRAGAPYFPTMGGVTMTLEGRNFGPLAVNGEPAPLPMVSVLLPGPMGSMTEAVCTNVVRDALFPHSRLTCTLPEGSGSGLSLRVRVGEPEQTSDTLMALSYAPPTIMNVTNLGSNITMALTLDNATAVAGATGGTQGGYAIRITGYDFGAWTPGVHCVGLTSAPGTPVVCNNILDSWAEGEVAAVHVLAWNHENITLVVPTGAGRKFVRVTPRGQGPTTPPPFTYGSPRIVSVMPTLTPTRGEEIVTIRGENFFVGPTVQDLTLRRAGTIPNRLVLGSPSATLPLPAWVYEPLAVMDYGQYTRINFFSAERCISSAFVETGVLTSETWAFNPRTTSTGCPSFNVLEHSHDRIVFRSLPGIGANRSLTVTHRDIDGTEIMSNSFNFSFLPPSVQTVLPSRIALEDASTEGDGTIRAWSVRMEVYGQDFGGQDTSGWTAEELAVAVTVGPDQCSNARRISSGGSEVHMECDVGYPGGTRAEVWPRVPVVGKRALRVFVAGQSSAPGFLGRSNEVHFVCQRGFYGLPNQKCLECPTGATCMGYDASRQRPGNVSLTFFEGPSGRFTECVDCHTRPSARPGFFNLKGFVNAQGQSESVCHPVRVEERVPEVECEYIVACDPPESCLAGNQCAEGYANRAWPFRCSQCENGYYRSAGSCRKCPDNPALNIVFFFLAAVVGIAASWVLNQKQVNLAFLTIGLDYMQVISIFANTRVQWPPQMKELFRILSAFNLNIELVAPECAFSGITYGQKWGAIMALPVAVFAILLCLYSVQALYEILIKGAKSKKVFAAEKTGPLASMALVLMYFLYLYITRSIFDVMTCRTTDPPEFDRAGREITYMAGVFERCFVVGGTHLTLLPGAFAALAIYVLAYPFGLAYTFYKNKELIMLDQLLRAKRTGDSALTNPKALGIRKLLGRTYYAFKPDAFGWVLAILLRKFCIAICALIFNQSQNFQLAAILLVIFVSYSAQVRVSPFMSPSECEAVIEAHKASARLGVPSHVRLAADLAMVEGRGRKRSRGNNFSTVFGSGKKITVGLAANALMTWLSNYNTMESLLLASALLVSLAGIMFSATPNSSAFYASSRDGVLAATLILIIASCLYWLAVVAYELYGAVTEESLNAAKTKDKSTERKNKALAADGSASGSAADFDSIIGNVESSSNPMFVSKSGDSALGTALSEDVLLSMSSPPDASLWIPLREQFLNTLQANKDLMGLVSQLKKGREGVSSSGQRQEEDEEPASPAPARKKSAFAPAAVETAGKNPLLQKKAGSTTSLKSLRK